MWKYFLKAPKGHTFVMLVPKVFVKKFPPAPLNSPKKAKITRSDQINYCIRTVDPYLDPDLTLKFFHPEGDAYRYHESVERGALNPVFDVEKSD